MKRIIKFVVPKEMMAENTVSVIGGSGNVVGERHARGRHIGSFCILKVLEARNRRRSSSSSRRWLLEWNERHLT